MQNSCDGKAEFSAAIMVETENYFRLFTFFMFYECKVSKNNIYCKYKSFVKL